MNYFEELNQLDCTKQMEKKGKFTYLSWAWAVQQLGIHHPQATWTIHEFAEGDGVVPYMNSTCGFFVKVTVSVPTVDNLTGGRVWVDKTQVHPVLNNQNKPILSPNAFDINTSIQRCLAKAIALHGLALHIYAGEDLPPSPEPVLDMAVVGTLDLASNKGKADFDKAWKAAPREQKKLITKEMIEKWKANIAKVAAKEAADE